MTNAFMIRAPPQPAPRPARLTGLSVMLGACSMAPDAVITGGVPDDYRLRHPIAITEANRSLVVFVGHGRGGLTATQRDDVMGLARTWVREGTGGDRRQCAGRYAERQGGRRDVPRNPFGPDGGRRAVARHRDVSLSSGRSADARADQAELYQDRRDRGSLRHVAGRSRSDRSAIPPIARTSRTTISAAPPSATSRPWSTIRPTWCSRDRRRRPIRRGAPKGSRNIARASRPRPTYPEAEKAKLSDAGK